MNFINSSSVDLYFWNTYFDIRSNPEDYDLGENPTERAVIEMVAQRVRDFNPGAHEELGFNIYRRHGDNVTPLL